ncbi:MAG: hypothetical protein RBR59_03745 [Sulfurimonadaceae bacterium]|jgi:hypothetical protein|nr:hypothetical protein [Sulfurimonadaceae bacterium]
MSRNPTKDEKNQEYNALYQGLRVKVVTSFTSGAKSIALIEDENGEIYEVSKEYIYEV